jgi:heat shock protein HslJ
MKRSAILRSVLFMLLTSLSYAGWAQTGTGSKGGKHSVEQKTSTALDAFFKVTGNERYWALEIGAAGISFQSNHSDESFTVPYATPAISGQSKVYRSFIGKKSKKKEIEVTITPGRCNDSIDSTFTHRVIVVLKYPKQKEPKTLEGCGKYGLDTSLNRVWTLAAIHGQKVIPNDFGKELPYIDIHSKIDKFTGFGGCNRISGALTNEGDLFKFTDIIATKMICLQNNKESAFMKALSSVRQYLIQDNMLYLYDDKEAVLIFRK